MVLISKTEMFYTRSLFLLFGVGVVMIAPRIPDIKANLQVNNGTLGTLISIGTLGALTALIFMGQIVHRFGALPVLIASATGLYSAMAMQPHIHSLGLFALDQVACGMGWAGFHITINSQGLYRQKVSGRSILSKLHGMWSLGALISAIISIGITSRISLAWHIDVGISLIWLATMYCILRLRGVLLTASDEYEEGARPSVTSIYSFLKKEWVIVIALTMGVMIETAANDWASLFTKEDIKASSSLSILSYVAFTSGMIIGRLNLYRLFLRYSERQLIQRGAFIGGSIFLLGIQIASHIAPQHPKIGLTFAVLAFLGGGLGSSAMAPGFTTIATRNSRFPASFVVSQMSLVNTGIFFLSKILISWVAQATSITTALMIPGAVLLGTGAFARLGSSQSHTRELSS